MICILCVSIAVLSFIIGVCIYRYDYLELKQYQKDSEQYYKTVISQLREDVKVRDKIIDDYWEVYHG